MCLCILESAESLPVSCSRLFLGCAATAGRLSRDLRGTTVNVSFVRLRLDLRFGCGAAGENSGDSAFLVVSVRGFSASLTSLRMDFARGRGIWRLPQPSEMTVLMDRRAMSRFIVLGPDVGPDVLVHVVKTVETEAGLLSLPLRLRPRRNPGSAIICTVSFLAGSFLSQLETRRCLSIDSVLSCPISKLAMSEPLSDGSGGEITSGESTSGMPR